jgi:hypothetical protein
MSRGIATASRKKGLRMRKRQFLAKRAVSKEQFVEVPRWDIEVGEVWGVGYRI